jgi:SAM-dependent methyltransferase
VHSYSDYFSGTAPAYALYRPRYPEPLFDLLSKVVPNCDRAWDCGTGTGQAALPLAARFTEVVATDPSEAQITQAERRENIRYAVMTGERAALADHTINLVTVAQALHWFDLELFYTEVRRVLRPRGALAVWSYGLFETGDSVLDAMVHSFYTEGVGSYWPPERKLIDDGYSKLPFPFIERSVPGLTMEATWTLQQLTGYLGTWSAVTRYRNAEGRDPVKPFIEMIVPYWGKHSDARRIHWPMEIRVGTV